MTINVNVDRKWLTTAGTILGVLASTYSTQIQALIQAHPQYIPYIAGAAALLAHYLPSPWQQAKKPEPPTAPVSPQPPK